MGGVMINEPMVTDMRETQVRSVKQVRQVLQGTQALQFRRRKDEPERFALLDSVNKSFAYR